MSKPTISERLWANVTVTGCCWYWDGYQKEGGYGYMLANRRLRLVHRLAYEEMIGPIPEGLQIDHICRTRNCVNPDHLEAVTQQENIRRIPRTVWHGYREQTHCKNGHEYTAENTRYSPTRPGRVRICRACEHDRYVRYVSRRSIDGEPEPYTIPAQTTAGATERVAASNAELVRRLGKP